MRLWYQSFARVSKFGPYSTSMRASLDQAADPGTEIVFRGIEQGGGVADQYRYIEYLDTREVIDNAIRAQREGFDAFLLGNIADPGLAEIREVLDIPALGLCQTSLHLACQMGRRYGLVTINPKFTSRIAENVTYYGLTEQLARIALMQVPRLTSLGVAFTDEHAKKEVVAQFRAAARTCIADGAEVLIPAGGVVMALLSDNAIREVDGVPILDGVPALVKMGELAVKLYKILGAFTSKAGSYAPPSGDVLDEIRSFYGPNMYG